MTNATATFWAERWKRLLAPPAHTLADPRKHRDHRPRRSHTTTINLDQPGES